MGQLVLHQGAQEVTFDQLQELRTPSPTATWTPVPHATLVKLARRYLGEQGFFITNQKLSSYRHGDRFFGLMELASMNSERDYCLMVGIRNSHDRSFPAGLVVGTRVFVCDNLAFNGEVKLYRKHTRFIERDLPGLMCEAVGRVGHLRVRQDARVQCYKKASLTDTTVHDLVIRACDARVIPNQRIPDVLAQWRTPAHEDFKQPTVWSLCNAFTEVLKAGSHLALPDRTTKLYGLLDQVGGVYT